MLQILRYMMLIIILGLGGYGCNNLSINAPTPVDSLKEFHAYISDKEFESAKQMVYMPIRDPKMALSLNEFIQSISKQLKKVKATYYFDYKIKDNLAIVIFGIEANKYTDNLDDDPVFLRKSDGEWKIILALNADSFRNVELENKELRNVANELISWYSKRKPEIRAEWRSKHCKKTSTNNH